MTIRSTIPTSGVFGTFWPFNSNLTQGPSGFISAAAWTSGNEGFIQQTFLGASIRNFNITAGFGDTTSNLSVALVDDEYNISDGQQLGFGDDIYHDGTRDNFRPPAVGAPVFFKFGKNFATIEQAWRKTFDDIYITNTMKKIDVNIYKEDNGFPEMGLPEYNYVHLELSDFSKSPPNPPSLLIIDKFKLKDPKDNNKGSPRGKEHFVFGGILQSYTQNQGPEGNPVYSVQVVDPREILSNTVVVLKNYAGSMFGNKNYLNVYGFLEYDVSDELNNLFKSKKQPGFVVGGIESNQTWSTNPIVNPPTNFSRYNGISRQFEEKQDNLLEKLIDVSTGDTAYYGNDMYKFNSLFEDFIPEEYDIDGLPDFFPITGQGMARVCDQGVPWYRIRQAMEAMFEYWGPLPQEYKDKGFGGPINFRGYNYVIDFTGIPLAKIPQMYFMDYDNIDLLSIAQELCDIISHDLFISLLPVIDHPASKKIWNYNNYWANIDPSKIIAGIIRIDTIDKTVPPTPGSIQSYLNALTLAGLEIENKDLGYELTNNTTDKMIVGAQEVEMYYFNTNRDRDNLELSKFRRGMSDNQYDYLNSIKWSLDTALKQQVLPFYGFIGENCPTIPRGFGSFQQILLDTSKLDAYGVGNYYIATEMEIRAASISYEEWSRFLTQYNELYIEEIGDDKQFWNSLQGTVPTKNYNQELINACLPSGIFDGREYGVSVPRSVFQSDKNYMGADGYPASPCCPPYGYPLYYKRAQKIGIPEAGIVGFLQNFTSCISNFESLMNDAQRRNEFIKLVADLKDQSDAPLFNRNPANQQIKILLDQLNEAATATVNGAGIVTIISDTLKKNSKLMLTMNRLAAQHIKNAKKVYNFIKSVADDHLGKSFLVKIPKGCNLKYQEDIKFYPGADHISIKNIEYGPFGFKPLPVSTNFQFFDQNIELIKGQQNTIFTPYLDNSIIQYKYGALKNNFNPINDTWEFNYKPESQGGFFNHSLFDRNLSFTNSTMEILNTKAPYAQSQLLAPYDLQNFVQENGRLKAYVRFDNSEFLDLSQAGANNVAQQIMNDGTKFIPDIMNDMDNLAGDDKVFFDDIKARSEGQNTKPRSVAFVKCEIEDKLYLLPQLVTIEQEVYGREVNWVPNVQPYKLIEVPPATRDPNYCPPPQHCGDNNVAEQPCPTLTLAKPFALPIFSLGENGGSDQTKVPLLEFRRYYSKDVDADLIDTFQSHLGSEHVYAIIKLPGRIIPTKDQRYLDGPKQAANGASLKHILTLDVVRGPLGFEKPAPFGRKKSRLKCEDYPVLDNFLDAEVAMQQSFNAAAWANPELHIGFTSPSPVYPNLVVLPLMSMERCYGPWMSSSIVNGKNSNLRYSDIGGKVEFSKNENLAPWNYGGYQLMNEAGSLEAQFSNSLLLLSERGGFVIPDAPVGIALAKTLQAGGPLVTSITVDIGDSIRTTVRMDLYTPRFGKLQKQKEGAISRIVRERQKIIDLNNSMARQGLGKSVSTVDLGGRFKSGGAGGAEIGALSSILEKEKFRNNQIALAAVNQSSKIGTPSNTSDTSSSSSFLSQNSSETHDQISDNQISINGSMTNNQNLIEGLSFSDPNQIANDGAIADITEMFKLYSNNPSSTNMAYTEYVNPAETENRYFS